MMPVELTNAYFFLNLLVGGSKIYIGLYSITKPKRIPLLTLVIQFYTPHFNIKLYTFFTSLSYYFKFMYVYSTDRFIWVSNNIF